MDGGVGFHKLFQVAVVVVVLNIVESTHLNTCTEAAIASLIEPLGGRTTDVSGVLHINLYATNRFVSAVSFEYKLINLVYQEVTTFKSLSDVDQVQYQTITKSHSSIDIVDISTVRFVAVEPTAVHDVHHT
jgi:hypothetical protein